MSTLFNTSSIHIELSSKCVLKCPRCPRTELDLDRINQEISLEDFQRGFPPDTLTQIKHILFCGDIGDPIYASDFLDIIGYIKQNSNVRIRTITNGSYKKTSWWSQLGHMLDRHDMVTFSVDGWDDHSNNQYRVNSNFASIQEGVRALRTSSACLIKWSTIYFAFNQDHIDSIRDLARELGCNWFQTVKSSKFDHRYSVHGLDRLKPRPDLVSRDLIYDTNIDVINACEYEPIAVPEPRFPHAWARCLNYKKDLFVGVNGVISPCPWFTSDYQLNEFVTQHRDRLNIRCRSFFDIMNDHQLWQKFRDSLDHKPIEICQLKCKNAQQ